MARVLSGVQPSGGMHLGNYLGAVRRWVEDQTRHDAYYCVVDLHALTADHDPAALADRTLESAAVLMAAGLDPDRCTLFVQSHVPEHSRLAWLLECTASYGELQRMTQFKDKARGRESVRVGLFTYPVLMAADILLYDADEVPVGDDQRQHLELTRDLAMRFNSRYGRTFVVPEATVPAAGARIMNFQQPDVKMSKSEGNPQGTVLVLDDPTEIDRKIRRAVTDNDTGVRYDPLTKPGVSNLVEVLAATTGEAPAEVAARYDRYGLLKADVTAAVVETLRPVRERYLELSTDPASLTEALRLGADKARRVAGPTMARASAAVGLLPAPVTSSEPPWLTPRRQP